MLQRDSTNSVTDLTFQETQGGFTRRRTTHMPHQQYPPLHWPVVRTRPVSPDFPCLGLGNLAVSKPSCLHRVAWQLGTERVLQLNRLFLASNGQELCCLMRFSWDSTLTFSC
ncbi:hypothetical protein CSKR_106967 [Clonorchis sinensis]|uniref:Uncharacterized protein n=1 Tax=Clonorchis sinensis TaxID=79923 RepID=A0A419Q689_CLOSI|nr:hypothetical protein CSKR_106967 [Clonorchis sinensis]